MGKRRPMVAGNWKMNTDRAGALRLALDVADGLDALAGSVDLAICPPFVYLDAVGRALSAAGSSLALGAQDVYFEPDGAFTGEVSTAMLKDLSCAFVLTGHSERRHVLGETDHLIARKTAAVLNAGMNCILCIGETLDQRRAGQTDAVNEAQVRAALKGLQPAQIERLTIAYEPVWAIGTGMTATPADAQDAHAKIRSVLGSVVGDSAAQAVRILYGGSVKPSNAAELFSQSDIDGGLIGGASLKSSDFLSIAKAALP